MSAQKWALFILKKNVIFDMKCNYGRDISVTKMEGTSMLHKHSLYIDNKHSEMGAFLMIKKLSLHLIRF